jgi:hypothetical protein
MTTFGMTARLSLSAATVFVLLIATLPAYAVTLVQGYYEEFKTKTCSAVISCPMPFSIVPAGKLLTVRHLSCRISTSGGSAPLTYLSLAASSRTNYLIPTLIYTSGSGQRTFYAGGEMLRVVEEGTAPQVIVQFAGAININLSCTLTGQITP